MKPSAKKLLPASLRPTKPSAKRLLPSAIRPKTPSFLGALKTFRTENRAISENTSVRALERRHKNRFRDPKQ